MSRCFALIPKGQTERQPLAEIDNAICAEFGITPHPIYFQGWYHVIGFGLACGNSFAEIRAKLVEGCGEGDEMVKMCDWLSERYDAESWVGG